MLKLILVGGLLVAVTVMVHSLGTAYWFRHLIRRSTAIEGSWRPRTIVRVLVTSALVLLTLHIVEVTIWAVVYLQALPAEEPWAFEQAVYFSLVTCTTLGYGDITLGPDLRLLSGIEALNGIVLVGWSTALLFAVLQRIWQAGAKSPAGSRHRADPDPHQTTTNDPGGERRHDN